MRPGIPSLVCDRVRAQISVGLDGELSQLERAMLASHLARCAGCARYEQDVTAFTQALRAAPLEPLSRPIVVQPAPGRHDPDPGRCCRRDRRRR